MLTDKGKEILSTKLLIVEEPNRSIGEEFIKYMDNLNLSFKTIEIYTNYFMQLDADKLISGNTQQYITDFINQRTKRNEKRISNHHHPVVRFFLKRLIDFFIVNHTILNITTSQLESIKTVQVQKATGRKKTEEKIVLSKEEVDKLVNNVTRLSLKMMIKLTFFCGLRMKELLGMTFEDIDLANKVIRIRPEIAKGKKGRTMPITDEDNTFEDLKKYLQKRKDIDYRKHIKNNRVFRLKRWQWQYQLEKCSLVALGRVVQPHALRHACGTFLSKNGADIPDIQKYLGHSNPQTTMLYIHKNTKEVNDKMLGIFRNYNTNQQQQN